MNMEETQMLKIAYYSATGNDLRILSNAVKRIAKDKGEIIEVQARGKQELSDDILFNEFLDIISTADVLIICLHGGKESCPGFEKIINCLPLSTELFVHCTSIVDAEISFKYSTIEKEVYTKLSLYLTYGGEENFRNMLLYLINKYGGVDYCVCEPKQMPWEGIYHPEFDYFPSLKEYCQVKYISGQPTVGMWFHREHWINNNVDYVDAFIKEFESRGVNVIALFRKSGKQKDIGNMGISEIVDTFFIRDGKAMIDVLINLMNFSSNMLDPEEAQKGGVNRVFEKLGVPVLKAIVSYTSKEQWEGSLQGLSPVDVAVNMAMPEFDGNIITLPGAFSNVNFEDPYTGAKLVKHEPYPERISQIVDISLNWARLRYISNKERKIAIIYHNYPPRNDTIGTAIGLDSHKSVLNILKELKQNGYTLDYVPNSAQDLMDGVLSKATNDRRWASAEYISDNAVAKIPSFKYEKWFNKIPATAREQMINSWGEPPGELFYHDGNIVVPGIINGNVFIGIQPPRGFLDNPASIYHSPDMPIPHNYYAYYEWIRNEFKADAVIHVGVHGNLEWLPGKAAGLSNCCYPQIAILDIPNIYIYLISNPGEGTQAKRRSFCCIIDHLIPAMTNAETYDEIAELETQIEDYYQCKVMDPAKLPQLREIIWEKFIKANLHTDLNMDLKEQPEDFNNFLELLHSYLSEIKDTQIKTGLHVLGEPPEGERLVEFLAALTRLPNGETPSLRRAIADIKGHDLDMLLENRGKVNDKGKTNGQVIEEIQQISLKLISCLAEKNYDSQYINNICKNILNNTSEDIEEVLAYICDALVPKILSTKDELSSINNALEGRFVLPGPSGAPTRGMAYILPTGRNFFSIDPQTVPSQAAWKVGTMMANDLLNRYLKDEGAYPENIGVVLLSTEMRTKCEGAAEVLYLMGVRPIWQRQNGYVKELEVIPLNELGRPRIDVTVRISGMFRNAFANVIDLIDNAVKMVALLDETSEENYIIKHINEDIADLISKGNDIDTAHRKASYRVFGCKPGAYGAGVCDIIQAKDWKVMDDLAEVYVAWSGYAYGTGIYGQSAPELFKKRLSVMDVAVMNYDSREYEMLDADDYYSFHGGLIAAVTSFKGKAPIGFIGDSSDPERVKTRTVSEEVKFELRSRILNPKWIESMKEHGYKGACDISQTVDHIFGWDATAKTMENWMYEEIAKKFVINEEFAEWIREVNPYALQNISERLLEAIQRGMWNASQQIQDELKKVYLDMEGEFEVYC